MEDRRQAEQRARTALATQMQLEVEERLAATEGRQAALARQEHAADEERWMKKEAEWQQKVEAVEAARSKLEGQLAASEHRLRAATDAAARQSALTADDRDSLLTLHARALEEVAKSNAELRSENARLVAQQSIYEEEMFRAEHESRLNEMESEEIRNAMMQAVGELVPLRNECMKQEAQLKEVQRAAAQLKHAKDADNASFMIAKKATARILRNKHMKALDQAVAEHKDKIQQVEKARKADQAKVTDVVSSELKSAEERHQRVMREQAEEEARRRQEAQALLKRQLEGENDARVQVISTEYERNMEVERRSAAAKLMQTSTRLKQEFRLSTDELMREQEEIAAKTLQQYADEAQGRIAELTAKADRLEAELASSGRELFQTHAALAGAFEMMQEMMHETTEGWQGAERKVLATEEEREMHRKRAESLAAECINNKFMHKATLERLSKEHAVERAVLLAEASTHDETTEALFKLHDRFNDMEEEFNALRSAHSALLYDSRQSDFDLKKTMKEMQEGYEKRIKQMQDDLQSMQTSYNQMRRQKEDAESKLRGVQKARDDAEAQLASVKAERAHYKGAYYFCVQLLQSECRREDLAADVRKATYAQQQAFLRSEAGVPLAALCASVSELEKEQRLMAGEFQSRLTAREEELDWQREETRRVKALVDGARQMANDAINKYRELEKSTAAKLAANAAEMHEVKNHAAKECERMLFMLTAEQEEHAATQQVLSDERHARGLDALEIERLHGQISELRVALKGADTARSAAELAQITAQEDFSKSEREHADHLGRAMQAMQDKLDLELKLLDMLDAQARKFDEQEEDHNAAWQAQVDELTAKHEALQADRDELQARFDWLLMRWTGREPRAQDVQMMASLQEELSRQMHLTAHAVQAAREYKEALRTNDKAYTHLFGLGALQPDDYVKKHNEMRAREAVKSAERIGRSSRSSSRPQSARASLPSAPSPVQREAQLGMRPPPEGGAPAPVQAASESTAIALQAEMPWHAAEVMALRSNAPTPKPAPPSSQPAAMMTAVGGATLGVANASIEPPLSRPTSAKSTHFVGVAGASVEPPLSRPTSAGPAGAALRPTAHAGDVSSATRWASASYDRAAVSARPRSGAPRAPIAQPAPPKVPRPYSARAAVMSTNRVVARRDGADSLGRNTVCMSVALSAAAETTAASRVSAESYQVEFQPPIPPAASKTGRLAGGAAGMPVPPTALTPGGDLTPW